LLLVCWPLRLPMLSGAVADGTAAVDMAVVGMAAAVAGMAAAAVGMAVAEGTEGMTVATEMAWASRAPFWDLAPRR
jgi:hypothetical protein